MVGEVFIEPLCSILCIDRRLNTTGYESTWPGVKAFLVDRLSVMAKFVEESKLGSPLDKLTCAAVSRRCQFVSRDRWMKLTI